MLIRFGQRVSKTGCNTLHVTLREKKATIAQPTINLSSIFRGPLIPYNRPGSKNRINSHKLRAKHIPMESIADGACLYSFIGSEAMLKLDKEYFPYDNDKIYWLSKSSATIQNVLYIRLQLALHFSQVVNGMESCKSNTLLSFTVASLEVVIVSLFTPNLLSSQSTTLHTTSFRCKILEPLYTVIRILNSEHDIIEHNSATFHAYLQTVYNS